MKRIVIVRSNPINPDSRVEKEANSLAKNGYDITLLAWNRDHNHRIKKEYKQLADVKVPIFSFGAKAEFGAGMRSIFSFLKFQISLFIWLIVNNKQYEIGHFCDFDTAFTGSIACLLLRKKYVFDIFDYLSTNPDSVFKKIIKKFEDFIINHSSATIICSEKRKEQVKGTRPKRLVVIHNSPDKVVLDNMPERKLDGRIKVVYVGILQDYRLLKEMVEVISKKENVEFHIGGFGKYENYMIQAAEKYENIFFYGKLQYSETLTLEKSCNIMTAIYDPRIGNHIYAAPNKFYEALFLGKPLIMVKGTGMSDILEAEKIGELIEYSKEGFAEGLSNLLDKRELWEDMSQRMIQLYEERYSWERMEERLNNLYKEL